MVPTDQAHHFLIVDDDREIRDLLARFFSRQGIRVTTAADGREMRKALASWAIDLVVLDLMLPGEDGFKLCRDLRARSDVPIIMLTVMGGETERIVGLEMGADDYLAKPFNPRELLARARAVLRRVGGRRRGSSTGILAFAGWKLDIGRRRLQSPDGVVVDLTTGEFDLLVALAEHPLQILTRDQLLDMTHGRSEAPFDRSIDMQVSRLRRKIELDPRAPRLIKTVRGGGYTLATGVTHHANTQPNP